MKELDVDSVLKDAAIKGFIPEKREIVLAGLHKARIAASNYFTEIELKQSISWLTENGYEVPKMGII